MVALEIPSNPHLLLSSVLLSTLRELCAVLSSSRYLGRAADNLAGYIQPTEPAAAGSMAAKLNSAGGVISMRYRRR